MKKKIGGLEGKEKEGTEEEREEEHEEAENKRGIFER